MALYTICCLNRNILECKLTSVWANAEYDTGLNRNILECKSVQRYVCSVNNAVLIETYWNVN